MSEQKMNKNEFYIGWMPAAPDGFAKHVRKVVIALIILVIIGGIVLVIAAKKIFYFQF